MAFCGYLVHPPSWFLENTNIALKLQTFLRIFVQVKGIHERNTMLNNTDDDTLAKGHCRWRQVEFLNIMKVLDGGVGRAIIDFTIPKTNT